MAVVQISRVQQRRGLQQDLPQLASAEFGWTLDQRRLFIGNGTISEGAPSEGVTEILTQYSDVLDIVKNYTFKGRAAGYTAQTGVAPANPVKRYWQDKLDDVVSVRDFGAVGDGVTNDVAAINRAIAQIYLYNRVQTVAATRRTIYFPAGVYLLSGDVVRIPPWLRIIGDGIGNTIIKQSDVTQSCALQFSDSKLQTGSNLGRYNAALATKINIESLTLLNDHEKDVVVIESTDTATFRLVGFASSVTDATEGSSVYAGIRFKSSKQVTQNINFELCQFSGLRYHLVSDDTVKNIKINGCTLRGGYHGMVLGKYSATNTSISNIRISNTVFSDTGAEAIRGYANCTGIVSIGNAYENINQDSYAIAFDAAGNYSIADNFDRDHRLVLNNKLGVELNSTTGLTMGHLTIGFGQQVTLLNHQDVATDTGISLPSACVFNYHMVRGDNVQTGNISYINTSQTTKFVENYQMTADLGVKFSFVNNQLMYTTTNSDDSVALSYSITQL